MAYERAPPTGSAVPARHRLWSLYRDRQSEQLKSTPQIRLTGRSVTGRIIYPSRSPWRLHPPRILRNILNSSGFILIDTSFRPIFANAESIRILGYPNLEVPSNPRLLDGILAQKILSFLPNDLKSFGNCCSLQFKSGNRSYNCRAFILEDHWNSGRQEKRIALLMERGLPGPPSGARRNRFLAGMYEDPFSFISNPRYYHFSRAHRETCTSLRNMVIEGKGTGVLFAQSGMGKTALINYMCESLRHDSEIGILPGSFENEAELVRSIMAILGVGGIGKELSENLKLFENWLLAKNRQGKRVILFCDDAQDLNSETLHGLCFLGRLANGREKLLQIVMAGRQDLLTKLSESGSPLNGELINRFCRLMPLDEPEVAGYVLHRLQTAGCKRQFFSTAALSTIALYSRGIPLNINMICRHCLSMASSINVEMIDERMVADSAYDLVLRTQPVGSCDDDPFPHQTPSRRRDRHGLRLVQKPQS